MSPSEPFNEKSGAGSPVSGAPMLADETAHAAKSSAALMNLCDTFLNTGGALRDGALGFVCCLACSLACWPLSSFVRSSLSRKFSSPFGATQIQSSKRACEGSVMSKPVQGMFVGLLIPGLATGQLLAAG